MGVGGVECSMTCPVLNSLVETHQGFEVTRAVAHRRWISESCRGDSDRSASVEDIKIVVVGAGCCAACDQSMAIARVANWCETCVQYMICGFDAKRLLRDENAGC